MEILIVLFACLNLSFWNKVRNSYFFSNFSLFNTTWNFCLRITLLIKPFEQQKVKNNISSQCFWIQFLVIFTLHLNFNFDETTPNGEYQIFFSSERFARKQKIIPILMKHFLHPSCGAEMSVPISPFSRNKKHFVWEIQFRFLSLALVDSF